MRGEEQGGGVLMRFLLYAVAMVLLAHAGGAEAGELLKPKYLTRNFYTKGEAVSALNAIDKECLLPVDVLGNRPGGKYRHYTYKKADAEKGEINFMRVGGYLAYQFDITLDLSTFRCLERGTSFWVHYSRLRRALDRASYERVRGRFDNIEWEEVIVEPLKWSNINIAHQEFRK